MKAILKAPMKLNLQYFADSEGQDNQSSEPADEQTNETDEDSQDEPDEPKEKLFTQKEFNEKLEKRLAREKDKAAKDKAESEKLAQMNEKQAQEYKLKQAEDRAKEAEDKLAHVEMLRQARNMLADSNINVGDDLLNILVTSEADTTKERVELLTGFAKGIEESVKTQFLKGNTPKNTASTTKEFTNKDFDKMSLKERTKLAHDDPDQFNKLTGGY